MGNPIAKADGKFSETTIDDEVVVMHLESGSFFSLTGTGRSIWQLIDGSRDQAALVAELAAEFGEDEAAIAADVEDYLATLRGAGLIAAD